MEEELRATITDVHPTNPSDLQKPTLEAMQTMMTVPSMIGSGLMKARIDNGRIGYIKAGGQLLFNSPLPNLSLLRPIPSNPFRLKKEKEKPYFPSSLLCDDSTKHYRRT